MFCACCDKSVKMGSWANHLKSKSHSKFKDTIINQEEKIQENNN